MTIGERIAFLRKERGIGTMDLADVLGITRQHLYFIENGERNVSDELKIKICNYFRIDMDYLFGFTDVKRTIRDGLSTSYDEEKVIEDYRKLDDDSKQLIRQLIKKL